MGIKDKRYTIEIFMRFRDKNISESNYVWHNSNGGLSKVVSNLNELHGDKWDYFVARRKSNKEIVGTFYNHFSIEIPAVRLYLKFRPNSKNNGVIANFLFKRNGFNISRGVNMSNSIILELYEDFFSIPENIYQNAIRTAKKALFDYYTLQGHQIIENEIELGDFIAEKFIFRKDRPGSYPANDYP
ncbi:hypothetical protein CMT22_17730 [Elizabethkingia anophelis]|nr:hypothetical protein [Elizabethkingia anophelis]